MEAGKSDQTGKVGEEVVRALNLPRPEENSPGDKPLGTRFWGDIGVAVAMGLTIKLATDWFATPLARVARLTASDAELAVLLLVVALTLLLLAIGSRVAPIKHREMPSIHLKFENRVTQRDASDTYFCIHGDLPGSRVGTTFCSALVSLWLLCQAWSLPFSLMKWVFTIAGAYCFYLVAWNFRNFHKPLFFVDGEGVRIFARSIVWADIEKVEFEHLMHRGNFSGMRWTFWLRGGKRRHRVMILPALCVRYEEEQMVAFAARMMGHEVSVAPNAPLSL